MALNTANQHGQHGKRSERANSDTMQKWEREGVLGTLCSQESRTSTTARRPLRIGQLNIRSLRANRDLVRNWGLKDELDVICFQETWLRPGEKVLPGL